MAFWAPKHREEGFGVSCKHVMGCVEIFSSSQNAADACLAAFLATSWPLFWPQSESCHTFTCPACWPHSTPDLPPIAFSKSASVTRQ